MATAQVQPISISSPRFVWLRSKRYDLALLLGTVLLAFSAGAAVSVRPALFVPILMADIILLGYHHVGSTFTRIAFDSESLGKYRAFLTWVPLLIAAVVGALAYTVGLWLIVTVYFYWQWFHYSRQSYGIAQAFLRKSGVADNQPNWLRQATFYSIPVWGILARSAEGPRMFLGGQMRALPVPPGLVHVSAFIALCLVAGWAVRATRNLFRAPASLLHTAYLLSHFGIFAVSYLVIHNLEHGWLVINIWHNAQYILFVWMFNSNRFKSGIHP
ncbi:MAG: hypothetical protein JOZ43_04845, partial [Acidobacteriales bacterium]|nr:hypothetical protein [Terriglobales bacterium]